MANRKSRSLENDLAFILNWLNDESKGKHLGDNTPASRARIAHLIAAIQEVNRLATKKLKLAGREQYPKCYFCNNFPAGKMKNLLEEIENRISEYPTTQIIYMDCMGAVYVDDGVLSGRRPTGEALAAHAVCRLTNDGSIGRINLCRCGRYFFGRFLHQRYCGRACKQKHHQGSKTYKANRREYMRWYYAMYQSPKQPLKKLPFEVWRTRH
jgi:hypothetical protein